MSVNSSDKKWHALSLKLPCNLTYTHKAKLRKVVHPSKSWIFFLDYLGTPYILSPISQEQIYSKNNFGHCSTCDVKKPSHFHIWWMRHTLTLASSTQRSSSSSSMQQQQLDPCGFDTYTTCLRDEKAGKTFFAILFKKWNCLSETPQTQSGRYYIKGYKHSLPIEDTTCMHIGLRTSTCMQLSVPYPKHGWCQS